MIDKNYNVLLERLNSKKSELKQRQEYFSVFVHNEINSSCFERNAINDLIVMQQLKSQIEELEHFEMLMRVQIEGKRCAE